MIALALRLLAALVAFCFVIVITQDIQIFPAAFLSIYKGSSRDAETLPKGIASHFVETSDGKRIEIWERTVEPTPDGEGKAVILFHGNAETVESVHSLQNWLASLGFASYSFDYRGFGKSSGWPSEEGLYQDSEAVWKFVEEERGYRADQIALFAFSIGAAPAAWLAERKAPRLLVLISPYTSLPDLVREQFFVGLLAPFLWYELPTIEYLKGLKQTKLILGHGERDTVISIGHSLKIMKELGPRLRAQLITSGDAGHNDLLGDIHQRLGEKIVAEMKN